MKRPWIPWIKQTIPWFVLISIVCLIAIGIFGVSLYWNSVSRSSRPSIIVTGLSALGTLLLAAVTFFNLQRDREEREKPLAMDEIRSVVQPAIDAVENNIQEIQKRDKPFDWVYVDADIEFSFNNNAMGRPWSVFSIPDPSAMLRLKRRDPDLWNQMQKHDDHIKKLARLASEIEDVVGPELEKYARTHVLETDRGEPPKAKVFVNSLLHNIDEFGESSEYYDLWADHSAEFRKILDSMAEEKVSELNRLEQEYFDHCDNLREQLIERKIKVQCGYGISSSDIEDDNDPLSKAGLR